jgi:alkylation response protein AidB-like acyl-CoA dehydrogenase
MADKYFSRRNLDFILYEVLDILSLTKHDYFSMHDAQTFAMTLDTATGIAEKTMLPAYASSDCNPPQLVNEEVKVHPVLHEYYKAFCASGLLSSIFDASLGGQQLPRTVYAAADFIVGGAHNGFQMFTALANAAAKLITTFGSKELIDLYAVKILGGKWAATMCLTETQAGSSLGELQTMAHLEKDGTYKIKGQKIFISAGDHDITENIVHLVLARIEDAPKGIKGISLFVVPKKRLNNAAALISNDVASIGIYHKMGQRSTPAMHLEFGGKNDCIGYLLGEANKGLAYMFQMMNDKRLGTGLSGIYIASAAYYASLQYAQERQQGRRLNNKNTDEPQVKIIQHPDVRRMLLLQKAIVEGGLSLLMQCYLYLDLESISKHAAEKKYYNDLLELLTPVAKTYGAEMGVVSVNNGMQVLGGYGYTEDFPLEQMTRDVRIMPLYEGTTGIQSIALLGRQVAMNNGRSLQLWKNEIMKDVHAAQHYNNIQCYADCLLHEMHTFDKVTQHLLSISAKGDAEIFLSDAALYMELFGILNVAWQWLKQATVAQRALELKNCTETDKQFYASKIHTMKFFFHYELVKTKGLSARLMDGEVLTVMNEEEMIL